MNNLSNENKNHEEVNKDDHCQTQDITLEQIILRMEQRSKSEISSSDDKSHNFSNLLVAFDAVCNSIFLFFQVLFNILFFIISETKVGKKILNLFVGVLLSYLEFGILTVSFCNHCLEKENKTFYDSIKDFSKKLNDLVIDFNKKIYQDYYPIVKERYDSLV